MNRDEILNVEVGRKMDALVAEKVMELSYILFDGTDPHQEELTPEYSTDIAAAWEVVEKLRMTVEPIGINDWSAHFGINTVCAFADTAPLAICRVALLAMMDKG